MSSFTPDVILRFRQIRVSPYPETKNVDMSGNLIGLSLSFCIRDVVEGKVNIEQVEKIYSSTRAETDERLTELMRLYKEVYWRKDPERGERIARAMFAQGLIIQNRLQQGQEDVATDITNGVWVNSEADIKYVSL